MFGKKKEKKVEQVFSPTEEEQEEQIAQNINDDIMMVSGEVVSEKKVENVSDKEEQDEVVDEKQGQLDKVKDKISKILKSSNIEIVDENIGDEYEQLNEDDDKKKQQDYDELKALFGGDDKNKKKELTLTLDDFDYTYVGQYVEEYDLQHTKSIKKIKMHRKHSRLFKRLAIAASVFIFVGVGIFLSIFLTREKPVYLKNVTLSQTEDTYYVSQILDPTELYFILEYSNGRIEKVNATRSDIVRATGWYNLDSGELTASGRAELIFGYENFTILYTVNIKANEIDEDVPLEASYSNEIFNMTSSNTITNKMLLVYINYTGMGKKLLDFSKFTIQVDADGNGNFVDCIRTTGGFKLPDGVSTSDSSQYKIIFTVSESETKELVITKNRA